jgi:cytochrome c551/c552
MSHIAKRIQASLTATRGKKALHTVDKLVVGPSVDDIANAPTIEALKDNFGAAYRASKDPVVRTRLKATYDARLAALSKPAKTLEQWVEDIDAATDATEAGLVLDEARKVLSTEDMEKLELSHKAAWTEA